MFDIFGWKRLCIELEDKIGMLEDMLEHQDTIIDDLQVDIRDMESVLLDAKTRMDNLESALMAIRPLFAMKSDVGTDAVVEMIDDALQINDQTKNAPPKAISQ